MHRHPLALAILVLSALSLPQLSAAAEPTGGAPARPNFLFVYTDDQRYDSLSVVQKEQGEAGRFPWMKTPNMDRLAAEGVRFRNAFVVNSLCAPSRAIFLTGRYSHMNGVANNHTPFPMENVTYSGLLRQAGYATAYCGKFHHGSQPGPRPGFEYNASFLGQGKFFDCPIQVNGVMTPSKGWVDDVTTDYAIDFIKKQKDKPFAVVVGYKSSHGPWDPPERLKGELADAVAKPPPNADAVPPFKGAVAVSRRPVGAATRPRRAAGGAAAATANDRSAMQRNYFRTLMGVDQNLGRLLQTLDDLKLADNTVVVFTSDNGYYLGEHGLGDKRSAYEESLRIPMLVRYPKLAAKGQTRDQMVLNLDIAPTFLDLAGVAVPKEMQGRSMKPLLAGEPPKDWRTAWFYEYFYERGFAQPTTLAVRTETAKIIKYPGHDDWTELFDLKADPHEKKNLYKDPAATELRKQMEAEFEKQAKAVEFRVPPFADDPNAAPAAATTQPAGAGVDAKPRGVVLQYDFTAAANGAKVADASKASNTGTISGEVLSVHGRDGQKARRFNGKSHIDVIKSASLNPAGIPFSIEIVFKAENPDGVLIARGGASQGFAVLLEKGKPTFVVTAGARPTQVQADRDVTGKWVSLTATVTPDYRLVLSLDGQQAGEAKLPAFIGSDPKDDMQIGADTGSPVTETTTPFTGLMESVKVSM